MAIGSEQEAFDLVLQEKIPKNLPKQSTKRKVKKPIGSTRIDPQSGEDKQIFLEKKEAEEKKEEANKPNLKKEERESLINMKKEKKAEDEKGRKRKAEEPSDLPSPPVPEDPAPAPVSVIAATPARKRGSRGAVRLVSGGYFCKEIEIISSYFIK